jgi:hypothetical protein
MMRKIEMFLACEPFTATHHDKKIITFRVGSSTRASLADKPNLVAAKEGYDLLLNIWRIDEPLDGPLALTVGIVFPYLAGLPKRDRGRVIRRTTKPDCSNLVKTIEDRLATKTNTKGHPVRPFITEDARVSDLRVLKRFDEFPGIYIRIEQLDLFDDDFYAREDFSKWQPLSKRKPQ